MTSTPAHETLGKWHDIVDSRDMAGLHEIIHPWAVFRSPAVYKPYQGREMMVLILSTVIDVFEDFTYHRTFFTEDGLSAVLEFSAKVGEREIDGVDIITFDEAGLIKEFKVMIRPLSSLMRLAEEMKARFEAMDAG